MIAIVDYGVGNLFSIQASLKSMDIPSVITSDAKTLREADKIILPGVGAFGDAIKKLRADGLDQVVTEEAKGGKPLLGICLGMQLLFQKSFEYGEHTGLSLLTGEVLPMQGRMPQNLRIPHIGWNALQQVTNTPLLKYVNNGAHVYFVHSFFVPGDNPNAVATAEYGEQVSAIVQHNNVFGCQFHPEKSGQTGLSILRAFSEI